MRPNPFDEFPGFSILDLRIDKNDNSIPNEFQEWRKKWEPILSEWGVALDEVQNTDPMSVEATLLRWRWRALHSERKLEAIKKWHEEWFRHTGSHFPKLQKILDDQVSRGSE